MAKILRVIEEPRADRPHLRITVVRCDCGSIVQCHGFTSTCDTCGADYNWNGDRLASREQWGEETGEHPADIARIK